MQQRRGRAGWSGSPPDAEHPRMKSFDYLEPRSLAETVRMLGDLAARGEPTRLLAGGTDLLIQMESGRVQPDWIISLGSVEELRPITYCPSEGLRIGSLATLRAVENHAVVAASYPGLARGAAEVGSVQIRNLATLAGNVCNASPSADTATALLAYDAVVELAGPGEQQRELPIGAFWKSPGQTLLNPGELVTAIRLPPVIPGLRSFYRKLAVRKAMDLAMVGVAITLLPGELPSRVRIALGAVGPVVFRAREAEALLESRGAPGLEDAVRLAEQACRPIDDQRASARYRRAMIAGLLRTGLTQLLSPSASIPL